MTRERAIVVLAKNPALGQVKTRLAQDLGDERALEIYKILYHQTLKTVESVPKTHAYVYQSPKVDRRWIPNSQITSRLQSKGNLGDRMHAALTEALSQHERVVLLGADCPGLHPEIIEEAFSALTQVDLVIGPSADGGFYLLGSKEVHPQLLQNRSWSHSEVFEKTVDLASKQGLSIYLLPELYDVDYLSDWKQWQSER